jgi:hypothetical protein
MRVLPNDDLPLGEWWHLEAQQFNSQYLLDSGIQRWRERRRRRIHAVRNCYCGVQPPSRCGRRRKIALSQKYYSIASLIEKSFYRIL